MTALFAAGTVCWGDTGKIELRPKGYALTNEAYVVPLQDGRDTVEIMESQAAELGVLRRHVFSQDRIVDTISADIVALESAVAKEREAWLNSSQKLQRQNEKLRSPWSIGAFAGYDAIHREACVGVGLVYSFWRF
ncbi:hypothetical protein [uncultured Cloacibacillus sp.]|uniref:hypothetical protein n=1 Tax=uncultured Cloacibacillus sp. TaxID=889794 RepID=UPI0027D98152|nr:hypothetical protein [uncultured Cloacibacillus sp.]